MSWGSQRSIEGLHAALLASELSWVAAEVGLGEEGEGQGGGLPSWKRPCLIVPD